MNLVNLGHLSTDDRSKGTDKLVVTFLVSLFMLSSLYLCIFPNFQAPAKQKLISRTARMAPVMSVTLSKNLENIQLESGSMILTFQDHPTK